MMQSPGFSVAPPNVMHREFIPHDLLAALNSSWTATHPPRTIEFHSVRDVFVVGEGLVFDRDMNLLQPSITQHSPAAIELARSVLENQLVTAKVEHISGTSLLCGKAGLNNYGHWLVEMLPLAYISRGWVNRADGWRVLVPHVYPWMSSVVTDSLDLLGVPADRRVLGTGEAAHFEELVVITGLSQHGQFFSPLIVEAMDAIARDIPPGPDQKIWVTRAGETRSLMHEAQANTKIEAAGWHVIHPGKISFREQVAFAKGAQYIAGVNGAGLSNLMFMRPGGTLISFVPAVMPDIFYWQLCGHRGLTYREIRSTQHHELGGPTLWDAPLTISVEETLNDLRKISGD